MLAFALLKWEDKYVSTIDALTIINPRKEIDKYVEGEYITARFKGKPYKAVIAELNDDRKKLEEKKRKGILKFRYTYKKIQNEDPQVITGRKISEHLFVLR
ncbi:hypothetical protein KUTeg_005734 [Tegillarca granosa]|uniref:Uncharacterized protein n=1 Tax=Tegillarca granosa TaxID=220873 RepID=A0ABQ9FHE5_TEGGR|nr:hypothetical protein KUTeg_005734 [Tegillarca granosa]